MIQIIGSFYKTGSIFIKTVVYINGNYAAIVQTVYIYKLKLKDCDWLEEKEEEKIILNLINSH